MKTAIYIIAIIAAIIGGALFFGKMLSLNDDGEDGNPCSENRENERSNA